MKLINDLSDQICEEIADAEKYAKWALAVKDDMPTVAQTLYTISGQELTHASMLHDLRCFNPRSPRGGARPCSPRHIGLQGEAWRPTRRYADTVYLFTRQADRQDGTCKKVSGYV